MKKLRINALCVLLSFLLTAAAWASGAELQAMTGSGQCGEDITWNLDAAGNLTVTGTGDFYDVESEDDAPWRGFAHYIVNATVSDGVSCVPDYAFANCDYLESVSLGKDVTTIGREAFRNCVRLTDFSEWNAVGTDGFAAIKIPDNVTEIGEGAFHRVTKLRSVAFGDGIAYLDSLLFGGCLALKTVAIPATVTAIDESAFTDCELDDVHYAGTAAQWNKIRGGGAEDLAWRSWKIHFESDGPESAAPLMTYRAKVTQERSEYVHVEIRAEGNGKETALVMAVFYDQNQRFLYAEESRITFPIDDAFFNFYGENDGVRAATVKVCVLDQNFTPLCQPVVGAFDWQAPS